MIPREAVLPGIFPGEADLADEFIGDGI